MKMRWGCILIAWLMGSAVAMGQGGRRNAAPRVDLRSVLASWTNAPSDEDKASMVGLSPQQDQEGSAREVSQAFESMRLGEHQTAYDGFSRVLAKNPANKSARFGLATTLIQVQQYGEAIDVLTPMVEDYPTDYQLKNNLAWLYATAKDHTFRDPEKAVNLAREALLLAPTDYHVWSTLAESHYMAGEYRKALRAAEQALALGENGGVSGEQIAVYRRQMEKCRRARAAMSLVGF